MPGARIVTDAAETAIGVEPDEFAGEPPPAPALPALVPPPDEERTPGFVDPGLSTVDPVVLVVPMFEPFGCADTSPFFADEHAAVASSTTATNSAFAFIEPKPSFRCASRRG